jgi:formamidopyrimidine-DNA glycosylase
VSGSFTTRIDSLGTGHLFVEPVNDEEISKYVHGRFTLDNDTELRFRDVRKFGTMHLVSNPEEELFQTIGPEPLDKAFTPAVLKERLTGRTTKIKTLLLDQSCVAGIGNIYADEACHHARINPEMSSFKLTDEQIGRLHKGIQHVLNLGIQRGGASIKTFQNPDGTEGSMQKAIMVRGVAVCDRVSRVTVLALKKQVYGRTGLQCLTCAKSKIKRVVLAQRSTHYCPRCQK